MHATLASLLGVGLLVIAQTPAAAADSELLKTRCASCHALTQPADNSLDRVRSRPAPDLYYAGAKFNRDWLVQWLQNPTQIRPAGYPYFNDILPGTTHDEIDKSKIKPHLRLPKPDAEAAADALMALKGPDGLVENGLFKNDKTNLRMAELAFVKLRGCSACHEGKDGEGGSSGPELTDAGKRLQPDFIASYIKNPQKIDPNIWMPAPKITDQDVQRLTSYVIQLSEGEKK